MYFYLIIQIYIGPRAARGPRVGHRGYKHLYIEMKMKQIGKLKENSASSKLTSLETVLKYKKTITLCYSRNFK